MHVVRPARAAALLLALSLAARARAADALPSFAQPAVSPDGGEIAFVNGGNIWVVPAAGGDAHLLVTGAGETSRPLYAPDGHRLAFISNRTGAADLYTVSLDDAKLTRVTYDDSADRLDAWTPDGRFLYFSTGGHDIGAGTSDVYRVPADGGTPMPAVAEVYRSEFAAAPAPDGHTVAFCTDGMAGSQWWRHGHSHLDTGAIWTTDGQSPPRYTRLTDDDAKHLWPMWGPDGRTLYYTSDSDGNENLYALPVPARSVNVANATTRSSEALTPPRQLTNFHAGRCLWPTLSADGRTIAFERDFGVWTLDVASGRAAAMPIRLRGVVAGPTVDHTTQRGGVTELAVSHDGKKLAFVVRGQIFAAPSAGTAGSATAFRVTHTDAIESDVTWANDDRRLAYVSTRDGPRHVYLYDFGTHQETRLTDTAANDAQPLFSPDDAALAFQRDGRELRALALKPTGLRLWPFGRATTQPSDRLLARGLSFDRPPFAGGTPFLWAPAGDWLACVSGGAKGFRNLYLVPATGDAPPRQASFLANAQSNSIAWSPDGKSLFFGSGQRTEEFQLARVDLAPRTPKFREDQFSDLFKERPSRPLPEPTPHRPSGDVDGATTEPATAPATEPTARSTLARTARQVRSLASTRPADHTEVVFDDIDQRLSLLPVGVDLDGVAISPDGKWLAFFGNTAGRSQVYLYPLDPLAERPTPRQLTVTPEPKDNLQFAADPGGAPGSYRLYYTAAGQVNYLPLSTGSPGTVQNCPLAAELDVDFEHDKLTVFDQAWRYLEENFHDPAFNGVDWRALRDRFAPRIAGAHTPADERRLLSLMIGELNASHLGVTPPRDDAGTNVARLGVGFDAAEYSRTGHLRVASLVPFGPAALSKVTVGQYILAVDGASTDRPANLEQLLEHKADKEVVLAVADAPGGARKDVRVLTVSGGTERTLMYRAWEQANRAYVAKASGGRLGYVHLADMGQQALTRLYTDLDARNEAYDGVVVDVRNNAGGFVNGYAIDVFARRNYVTIEPRGFPKISGRAALGQRFLGLPTILVTNRETLSDGEDFTEGYQALGLGDTVGEPTAGWIIFTSGCTLLDGTGFRIPGETVLDAAGNPMELHPRPVTYAVPREEGEATAGHDSQLDEAVRQLLRKTGGARP